MATKIPHGTISQVVHQESPRGSWSWWFDSVVAGGCVVCGVVNGEFTVTVKTQFSHERNWHSKFQICTNLLMTQESPMEKRSTF